MNTQEILVMNEARLAREAALVKDVAQGTNVVILPPPGAADPNSRAQIGALGTQSPVVVAGFDSEETWASLPLKRRMRENSVTSGAVNAEESRPLVPPNAGGASSGTGGENLQIRSTGGLVAFLFSIIHNARVFTDFDRTLESVQRECDARADRIKEMNTHAADAQKLLQKCKAAIKKKDEEIAAGKGMLTSFQESLKKMEEEKKGWMSREVELNKEIEELKKRMTESDKGAEDSEVVAMEKASEVEKLTFQNHALENDMLDQYEKGYSEALFHVKFFHPEEDLGQYDAFGEVKDGKFVKSSFGDKVGPSGGGESASQPWFIFIQTLQVC